MDEIEPIPVEPHDEGSGSPRWILWVVLALVAVTLTVALLDRGKPGEQPGGLAGSGTPTIGGPFALTATDGSTVTDKTLAGKPFAIFFGYTRCPDVCPTSLARMARLRQQLGANGMKFTIVFVSVDPDHDKPADLGHFIALFGTPIIGLTGTDAQIDQIKQRYGVFSQKVPQPGGDYTVDHTAAIYLMDAKGAFSGTIDYQESDTTALEKLTRLIG